MNFKLAAAACVALMLASRAQLANAQGYGTDLQNVMTPAAGGMAGVSLAQPQDVSAATFGNPATLSQFKGTQFSLGGAFMGGTPKISNNGSANPSNGFTPFSVESGTEGFVAPSIAVTQELCCHDIPFTLGMGLSSLSGLGAEYLGRAPGTLLDNFSSEYLVLGLTAGAGVQVTDRLSVGASMTLGTAFEQLGFVGPIVSSSMVNAYALRGTVGADYALDDYTMIGAFWQSKLAFDFQDGVRVGGNYRDLRVDQPDTFGIGISNHALMDGNLLLAADVYYKDWEDAALWQDMLVNQWVFAVGAQYTCGCYKYRIGYSYNTDPINHNVGSSLDGFPIAQSQLQLTQAGAAPLVNQNRLTLGLGKEGVLIPNLDLDLFGGILFNSTQNFGPDTQASLLIYYVGLGLTWKFDNCSRRPSEFGTECFN